MEMTLAILMVLGIFVGIPAVVGFAGAGMYIVGTRRAAKAEHAKAMGKAEVLKEPTALARP